MDNKYKLSTAIILSIFIILFASYFIMAENLMMSCSEDSVKKECTNMFTGKKTLEVFEPRYLDNHGNYKKFNENVKVDAVGQSLDINVDDKFSFSLEVVPILNKNKKTWSQVTSSNKDVKFDIPIYKYENGRIKWDFNVTNGDKIGKKLPDDLKLMIDIKDLVGIEDKDIIILDDGLLFGDLKLWIPSGCADINKTTIMYTTLNERCLDPSLEVSDSVIMGGNYEYSTIIVNEGGQININESIGWLNLTATESIYIHGNISGTGKSNNTGGINGGAGGAGGSFTDGSPGGNGDISSSTGGGGGCGAKYAESNPNCGGSAGVTADVVGTESGMDEETISGAGGGAGGGGGGGAGNYPYDGIAGSSGASARGGATIRMKSNLIYIDGIIHMDGTTGANGGAGGTAQTDDSSGGGGGGGAGSTGGQIILQGLNINISNSLLTVYGGSGGSGGAGYSASYGDGLVGSSGQGGNGGRIKVFYSLTYYNESSTLSTGTLGTYFAEQNLDLGFNNAPTIHNNKTIPNSPVLTNENVYINVTTNDAENDSIYGVYFTIKKPSGAILIDNENGTLISGNSKLGENETWNSNKFNITSTTDSLGIWNWNFTIISNGSNPNTISYGTFTILDNIFPNLTITSPLNNTIIYRNQSIDLNFTANDNVELDTCWFTIDEGVTNITITNCLPTTFSTLNGTYNISVWTNDTSNNLNKTLFNNITFLFDNIKPVIDIISPSTDVSTLAFDVEIDVTDLGKASYCMFNITRGASVEVSNTQIANCSSIDTSVSSDATYLISIFVNDTTGNFNVTNKTFTVDTSTTYVPPTGGGGSTTVIVGGEPQWSMETDSKTGKYELRIVKNSAKTKPIVFSNLGGESVSVELSCIEVAGYEGLCKYVTFEQNSVSLPLSKEIKTYVDFTISLDDSVVAGDYLFNIVGTDEIENSAILTVETNVETNIGLNFFTNKLSSSKDINGIQIPYLFIFMLLLVTLFFLLITFRRIIGIEIPGWVGISVGLSFIGSVVILFII